jgi:hypothetical protein
MVNELESLLREMLPLLVPVILIQLGLMIYCLVDISRREMPNDSKLMWLLLIVLVNFFGPIAYLLIIRKE